VAVLWWPLTNNVQRALLSLNAIWNNRFHTCYCRFMNKIMHTTQSRAYGADGVSTLRSRFDTARRQPWNIELAALEQVRRSGSGMVAVAKRISTADKHREHHQSSKWDIDESSHLFLQSGNTLHRIRTRGGSDRCIPVKAHGALVNPGDAIELEVWNEARDTMYARAACGIVDSKTRLSNISLAVGMHAGTIGVICEWVLASKPPMAMATIFKQGLGIHRDPIRSQRVRIKFSLSEDMQDGRLVLVIDCAGASRRVRLPSSFAVPLYPCATLSEGTAIHFIS